MRTDPPALLITCGDPAGIGPEIVLQACVQQPAWAQEAVLVGHLPSLERARSVLNLDGAVRFQTMDMNQDVWPSASGGVLRVHPVAPEVALSDLAWGQVGRAAGHVAGQSV